MKVIMSNCLLCVLCSMYCIQHFFLPQRITRAHEDCCGYIVNTENNVGCSVYTIYLSLH